MGLKDEILSPGIYLFKNGIKFGLETLSLMNTCLRGSSATTTITMLTRTSYLTRTRIPTMEQVAQKYIQARMSPNAHLILKNNLGDGACHLTSGL